MATVLTSGQITELQALTLLEEQASYISQKLLEAQKAYNTANVNAPKTAVIISPDLTSGSLNIQMVLPIDAATAFVPSSVTQVF